MNTDYPPLPGTKPGGNTNIYGSTYGGDSSIYRYSPVEGYYTKEGGDPSNSNQYKEKPSFQKGGRASAYEVSENVPDVVYSSPYDTYGPPHDVVGGVPLYSFTNNGGAGEQDNALQRQKTSKFILQGYKDVWAAVLFLLCLIILFILGCYNFNNAFEMTNKSISFSGSATISAGKLVGAILGIVMVCMIVSVGCLAFFCKFPKGAIVGANVASGVLMILSSIASFLSGSIFGGVFLLIFGLLSLAILYFYRRRIAFSAILLKSAANIVMQYSGIVVFSFLLIGLFTVFTFFWGAMVFPTISHANDSNTENAGMDAFLGIFGILMFFWTSQVLFNIAHVTSSGVAATWYFVGAPLMPANPSIASFRRATSYSFGSICFGSLFVAILQLLRAIARSQRNNDRYYLACIIECILSCVEQLMRYFNRYAFVYVAIYGYGYIDSAKKTYELAKSCAFEATFNDSLIGTTLCMTSFCCSGLMMLVFRAAFQSLS
eukprot:Tbor_TRINITY_DN5953_c1_g1::TRINITY_DN5953_c1_g1_i6::g.18510::m.18510